MTTEWKTGNPLWFTPGEDRPGKSRRRGEYVIIRQVDPKDVRMNVVEVKLDGDPFTVCVYQKQITPQSPTETESEETNMAQATATRTPAKELRRQARSLGIEGWEDMGLQELRTAVESAGTSKPKSTATSSGRRSRRAEPVEEVEEIEEEDETTEDDESEDEPAPRRGAAKKATSNRRTATKAPATKSAAKKAPAKKAAVKAVKSEAAADEVNENGNPYKRGTNLYEIAEQLIRGGKRSEMVRRLKQKITLNPRSAASDDWDEDAELDRRILIVGQLLRRDHDFNVVRDGRGGDATIVAERP